MEACILVSQDIVEVELAQVTLINHGILSIIQTNDASGMLPHLRNAQGVQLYVAKKDAEEAKRILNS